MRRVLAKHRSIYSDSSAIPANVPHPKAPFLWPMGTEG
ncbi:hypothetical protein GFS31_23620 [Leptolyngbya sp. BL0902]|nr:hypothetical protein GFS31_23620 [Leptolyngbya sp. BL0902]